MKTNLKVLWLVVLSAIGTLLVSEQLAVAYPNPPGCVDTFQYTWGIQDLPTAYSVFSLPEPGLTNETMTLSGEVGWEAGTLDETDTESGCIDYTSVTTFPWPITETTLGWSTYFINSETPLLYGSFSPGLGYDFNVSFVSPQWGNEWAFIDLIGTATYHFTGEAVAPIYIPFSILPRRPLIYLSFDNSALPGDRGQLPILATNVTLVPSPFGTGINFDSTQGIHLEYPAFQSDTFSVTEPEDSSEAGMTFNSTGSPNIRRNEGTIQFWFQPNWSSGSGPANGGVFFDMLNSNTPSAPEDWTLVVTNNGTTVEVINAGGGFSEPVSFTSNQWYQIAVTYSGTQTALYTNGVIVGSTGTGVSTSSQVSISSFLVGSDGANEQVRGIMDEVRTYNYVMSSSEVQSNYEADASLDTDGAGVPNLVQFEEGINPSAPPGGSPNINPPTTESSAPVIQLLEPVNAVQN